MKTIKWVLSCLAIVYACCVVYALVPQQTVPVQELAGANSHFMQVKGRQFHYEQYGSGKPIVLVHGFAGSTYTWRNLIPLLAKNYTVYAFDLPGFGLSDKSPDAGYDMQSQAGAVLDFISALNLPSVVLVGHSMGGVITGFAATLAPQKIEKAVIIDAGFYHGGSPKFFQKLFFPFNIIMARSFYTKSTRSRSLASSYYNQAFLTDDLIEHYLRPTRTPHAVDALATMMRTASGEIYEGISSRITVPTLLIWARQDKHIPMADADRLHNEIKNSQLVVIEQSGHMVQEEQPQQVADAIRQFVQ